MRTATACSRPGCARTTRDRSGRCHDHRALGEGRSSITPPPSPEHVAEKFSRSPTDDGGWCEEYRYASRLHRIDGPARRVFDRDRNLTREEWFIEGRHERADDLPNIVKYSPDGSVETEEWKPLGRPHRESGPARIFYEPDGSVGAEVWSTYGQMNRIGGPAHTVYTDGKVTARHWYRNGERHRIDGPAVLEWGSEGIPGADEEWWVDGERYDDLVGVAEYLEAGLVYDSAGVVEMIEESDLAPLLTEDHLDPYDVVAVLGKGVRTVEGIREVRSGAPVEWVRSFEESVAPSPDTAYPC